MSRLRAAASPRSGRHCAGEAARIIDADGLAVAPGFIDIKTHSDFVLPINPKAESKVRQGVTTEIIGHCGFSVAPVPARQGAGCCADYLSRRRAVAAVPRDELSRIPRHLSGGRGQRRHAGRPQHAAADGHGPGGPRADRGRAGADDRAARGRLAAGALGLSTGLFTPPGSFAAAGRDAWRCAPSLARHKAGYFTHIRDESNQVLEAVDEAIAVARAYPIHVEIVHLKCSGLDNWGKAGADPGAHRAGARRRLRHRLRRLSLRRRRQPAEEPVAALGAGRRQRGDAGAAGAARDPGPHRGRDRRSRPQQLGPHPVLGGGAGVDLAEAAAARRQDRSRRSPPSAAVRPDRSRSATC